MATRIVEGTYSITEQFENRFAVAKSETVSYHGRVTTNNDFR